MSLLTEAVFELHDNNQKNARVIFSTGHQNLYSCKYTAFLMILFEIRDLYRN